MSDSPEAFVERLKTVSTENGVPFARLSLIRESEEEHLAKTLGYKGYWALSDAFKCLVLETTELINTYVRPRVTAPLSEHYGLLLPRMIHSYRSICGAERVASLGYPMQGFTLLRNVFDDLVLTSGAVQKITDFYSIEGVVPGKTLDEKEVRKLKKNTEFTVRKKMTGSESGLREGTVDDLRRLDALFDYETHGGQLSLAEAMPWMKGQGPLRVVPDFAERRIAAFFNRSNECEWMVHRLLPLIQPPTVPLPPEWRHKWRVIDDSFATTVRSLTEQLEKRVGASISEFMTAKFPFNERSTFPL
jgi:hypothetical protein